MTKLLEKAFVETAKLPADRQDAIAALVLAELEDEDRWAAAFEQPGDVLAYLAQEAREEHALGRTSKLS